MQTIQLSPELASIWDIQYSDEIVINFVHPPATIRHGRNCEKYNPEQEISVVGERWSILVNLDRVRVIRAFERHWVFEKKKKRVGACSIVNYDNNLVFQVMIKKKD